jgi:DNA (cytosine-5)-methyltransferase 1
VFLSDILESEVDSKLIMTHVDAKIRLNEAEITYELKAIRVGEIGKGGQGERIYSVKGHAVTQSAHGGGWGAKTGLYNTPQGVRRLTLTEGKRVMGFPDTHIVSAGTQGYQQLGNAVIPVMIGLVYDNIEFL